MLTIIIDPSPLHTGILIDKNESRTFYFFELKRHTKTFIENITSKKFNYYQHYVTNMLKSEYDNNYKNGFFFNNYHKIIKTILLECFQTLPSKNVTIVFEDYSYGSVTNNLIQTGGYCEKLKETIVAYFDNINFYIIPILSWKNTLYKKFGKLQDKEMLFKIADKCILDETILTYKKGRTKNLNLIEKDLLSVYGLYYFYLHIEDTKYSYKFKKF